MSAPGSLEAQVREALATEGPFPPSGRVVVGVSGGLDSCVLLHALRFAVPDAPELVVAHFDHATRPDSSADGVWVRGVCHAWGLPFRGERAERPPRGEDAARRARYDYLERVRIEESASVVVVGHHADDQAETVLFRVLRGTGIGGLAAMPTRREPPVLRPLLGVWRQEIEAYAHRVGLTWRLDPTNDQPTFARNVLRHELLPRAEEVVAPAARRSLVRLARLAAENEAAWKSVLADTLPTLGLEEAEGLVSVDRAGMGGLHEGVRARVLRSLAERLDVALDEVGTRLAVEFTTSGRSGSGIDLGGGVELRRQLDRLVLRRPTNPLPDRPLSIPGVGPGSGAVWLGGRRVSVWWGGSKEDGECATERFEVDDDCFPIVVRAPEPGDRMRLPGGSKKLKKLFLEARIPADERKRAPVVVDARGRVLWVPGLARAPQAEAAGDGPSLEIRVDA